jgi:hypothetical protein
MLVGLSSCGSNQTASQEEQVDEIVAGNSTEEPSESAVQLEETADPVVGEWVADAIVLSSGNIVKLEDNEALADLYDTNWVTVYDDGTYSMYNGIFTYTGIWYTSWKAEYDHAYTFEEEGLSRLTESDTGELETQESESSGIYRIYLENDDTDTLIFVDADAYTLLYIRKGTSGDYVDANKMALSSETTDQVSIDEVDTLLQGTWEYCDEDTGSVESITFHNGTLDYMNYMIGVEGKVNTSAGTYQITEENIITTINDFDVYFDYQVEDGVLSFSWYITSGADKGNTRVYEKIADGTSEATNGEPNKTYTSVPAETATTTGEKNALADAKAYLSVMAFSYDRLVDQLEYEGYTYSEAVYGVDHCGADWYEQAAKCAKSYLEIYSFSRSELIDQLEYEGFTYDQAVYGAKQNGY